MNLFQIIRKYKIILVDNDEWIRDSMRMFFENEDCQIYTFETAEEALQVVSKLKNCIYIVDYSLPGMNGLGFFKKINSSHPDAVKILISAYGNNEILSQLKTYDIHDFIEKPFTTKTIEEVFLKLINQGKFPGKINIERSFRKIHENRQIADYTKQLESVVKEKDDQMKENDRLVTLGQTVAGIAHGIKNIASGLKGGEFILEQGIIHEDKVYIVKGWEMIKGNLKKVSALSMDMLNYSKISENNFMKSDPDFPVREVIDLLKSKIDEEGIQLYHNLSGKLTPVIFDSEGIHCLILNLMTNAIEAFSENMEFSKKEIHVESSQAKDGGVQYKVSDTANGIDPKNKNDVFKKFFTTKGKKGTGFGLMLTKKIVDQHNGQIEFVSDPNGGTCFTINIPGNNFETKIKNKL